MPLRVTTTRRLVEQFLPVLHFAPVERFFPSDVEAWLTNSMAEDWATPGSRKSGSAIIAVPDGRNFPADFGNRYVVAGSNFPDGNRLTASAFTGLISRVRDLLQQGQDVFIDYGGWLPEGGSVGSPDFTQGSEDRLYTDFSPLAHAMNPGNPEEPDLIENPSEPDLLRRQGRQPVLYAEVEWAGRFTRLSDQNASRPGRSDFGPDTPFRRLLDGLGVITYYFFYPMTDLPPNTVAQHAEAAVKREGQWEAISIYFRVSPDFSGTTPGVDGITIPDLPDLAGPATALFLAYSRTMVLCALGILLVLLAIALQIASLVDRNRRTNFAPTGPDNDFVPPGGPSTQPAVPGSVTPVVRMFSLLPPASDEKGDELYQLPAWWNYPGRWGVRVTPSYGVRWDNGTRRMDQHGRSRAYWNTLALFRWMNLAENRIRVMELLG